MNSTPETQPTQLSEPIRQLLQQLVEAARKSFGSDLASIILFGSAAEGRLRPTSDLNLLVVLKRFEKGGVDAFREPLRLAQVAARATAMFILEAELPAAAEAFAVKFDDIARRHRVLYGEDSMARLTMSRAARKQRLGQVLLNLALRLRERYAVVSLREEQLAVVIAETAGPLRAAASTLAALEGQPAPSPKEALERIAASETGQSSLRAVEMISRARQAGALPAGAAPQVVFDLIQLAQAMRSRAERLD